MKVRLARRGWSRPCLALGLAAAMLLHVGTPRALAYTLEWVTTGGSWPIADYWYDAGSAVYQVPTTADDAIIDNGGNAAVRNQNCQARNLTLGSTSSGRGKVAWRDGNTRDLTVAEDLFVGYYGTGTLTMLRADNPVGEPAKTLSVGDEMSVGRYSGATGTVAQDYGTVEVNRALWLGHGSGGQGTYTISGDAELTIDGYSGNRYLTVGVSGTGEFNQHGGTVTVGRYFRVAEGTASHGTYTMTDGVLDVSGGYSIILGRRNDGHFIQSGGTVLGPTATQGIYIGFDASGVGEWQLSGTGHVDSGRFLQVGRSGSGAFTQSGGSMHVPTDATLGYGAGSDGTYTISGGQLDVDGNLAVGGSGTGTLKIVGSDADIHVGGNYTQNAASTLNVALPSSYTPLSRIHVAGNATFAAGATLDVDIPGAAVGRDFAILHAGGTITDNGLTLDTTDAALASGIWTTYITSGGSQTLHLAPAAVITTADGNGADTHLYENSANSNYGARTAMYTRQSDTQTELPYLRFDLTDVSQFPTLTSARLQLYDRRFDEAGGYFRGRTFEVWGLTDEALDNWIEGNNGTDNNPPGEITWNFAPGHAADGTPFNGPDFDGGAVHLGDFVYQQSDGGWGVPADVPGLLEFLNADTNGLATLMLIPRDRADSRYYIATQEAMTLSRTDSTPVELGSQAPRLIITAVPEPTTLTLLALGGLGLLARRRRRR